MSLEIGLFLPHVQPEIFQDLAIRAEERGFDFICCDDHLISPFPPMGSFDGCYEAWTAMAYLAAKTNRVKLTHMTLIPTFRNPAVLAKMAATLDLLSGGRLILNLGAGWYRREFEAFNLPWEGHRERIQREREAIAIIRALWTEGEVSHQGKYYSLDKATLFPKPLQKPTPPIWVGGDSRSSMELAAELGDGWLFHGHSVEEARRMIESIKPLLRRNVAEFSFCTALFVSMGANAKSADAKFRQMIPEGTWNSFMKAAIRKEIHNRILGSPEECIRRIHEYTGCGVTNLITIFVDPGDVEVFASKVLPEVREREVKLVAKKEKKS
jgi:dimethylsulfone monooxygenase